MNAFLAAVAAAILLGIGAMYLFTSNQQFAYQAFATSGVRVSEPGHNLVGPSWTGNPKAGQGGAGHGTAGHDGS